MIICVKLEQGSGQLKVADLGQYRDLLYSTGHTYESRDFDGIATRDGDTRNLFLLRLSLSDGPLSFRIEILSETPVGSAGIAALERFNRSRRGVRRFPFVTSSEWELLKDSLLVCAPGQWLLNSETRCLDPWSWLVPGAWWNCLVGYDSHQYTTCLQHVFSVLGFDVQRLGMDGPFVLSGRVKEEAGSRFRLLCEPRLRRLWRALNSSEVELLKRSVEVARREGAGQDADAAGEPVPLLLVVREHASGIDQEELFAPLHEETGARCAALSYGGLLKLVAYTAMIGLPLRAQDAVRLFTGHRLVDLVIEGFDREHNPPPMPTQTEFPPPPPPVGYGRDHAS